VFVTEIGLQAVTRLNRKLLGWRQEGVRYKFHVKYSGVRHNERMLQGTVSSNKIRMLQRTRRNTIGRRSTRVRMTCRAFPL